MTARAVASFALSFMVVMFLLGLVLAPLWTVEAGPTLAQARCYMIDDLPPHNPKGV